MKSKSKINKFIDEYNKNGLKLSLEKTSKYLNKEFNKVVRSYKLASSDNYIIVSWSDIEENKTNFGDALNPILVSKLSRKKTYSYSKIHNIKNEPVYSVIGSVLDNCNINNLEVWGSGFISDEGRFVTPPKKIHAVRGPLTRNLILKQGIECPEIYGDPALLISQIYKSNENKQYKIGLIPHYVDKDNKYIKSLKNKYKEEVLIIDIQDNFKNVIDNINKCETIASSSLHGIIIADSYDIPTLWIELSDNVMGEGFKFRDYMLSVDKKQMKPFVINKDIRLTDLLNLINYDKISFDYNKLLNTCPFLNSTVKNTLEIKED